MRKRRGFAPSPYGFITPIEAEYYGIATAWAIYQQSIPVAGKIGGRRLHTAQAFFGHYARQEQYATRRGIDPGINKIVARLVEQYQHWQALRDAPMTPPATRRAALAKERKVCEAAGIPFNEDDYPPIRRMYSPEAA